MAKVRGRRDTIVNQFRGGGESRLAAAAGVDVLMGTARFVGVKEVAVALREGGEVVRCKAEWVFLNVGERPVVPEIEGLEEVKGEVPGRVLDSTSIQAIGEVPASLLVLGGGYVGVEFAHLFSRLGSKVTIVQRGKRLLPREDPEIVEELRKILVEDGLEVICEAQATHISTSDDVESPITLNVKSSITGVTSTHKGSHILLATGRRPNTDTLNLEATGVSTDKRGYIPALPDLSTGVSGIWSLGDVNAGPSFTHVSYDDFRIIRDNLGLLPNPSSSSLDKPTPRTLEGREKILPYVVYTDPQLGHVGLHAHDIPVSSPLRTEKRLKVAKMPMSWVARALETDETRGMMKAVVDGESGEILGFTCLGIEGGEIMSVVQMAMMGGVKWWKLREAIWAHPTLAESLNNLWGSLEDV
jgi:pyruvate/2-oxoglutarate dehydrogenase complex dihydrolipoamide dehydrogenase (E3) component